MRRPTRFKSASIVADQALNSATNFGFAALAASNLSVNDFGLFAVAQLLVLIGQMAAQAGFGDLLLRSSAKGELFSAGRRILARATFAIALVVLAIGLIFGMVWWAVALLCAIMVIRLDHVRTYLLSTSAEGVALGMDALYGGAQVGLLVLWISASEPVHLLTVFLIWFTAAAAANLVVMVTRPLRTTRVGVRLPLKEVFQPRYAAESVVLMGSGQASQLAVAGAVGLSFAAAIRGAQLLFGPIALLIQSSRIILLPRYAAGGSHSQLRTATFAAGALVGLTIGWAALILAIYGPLGQAILGSTAAVSAPLIVPVSAAYAAQAIHAALFLRARANIADRATTTSRTLQILTLVAGSAVAIAVQSPSIYLWGMTVSSLVATIPLLGKEAHPIFRTHSSSGRH